MVAEEFDQAIAWHGRAAQIRRRVLADRSGDAYAKHLVWVSLSRRAEALAAAGKLNEAVSAWRETLAAAQDDGERLAVRVELAAALVRSGDHAQGARMAAEVVSQSDAAAAQYDAARVFWLASEQAARTDAAGAAKANELSKQYAARAVACLQKVHAAGFFRSEDNRKRLFADTELAPLRNLPQVRKFLGEG
jgi:hypothetical protein